MSDLKVSYDKLEQSQRNLKVIKRELDDTGGRTPAAGVANPSGALQR